MTRTRYIVVLRGEWLWWYWETLTGRAHVQCGAPGDGAARHDVEPFGGRQRVQVLLHRQLVHQLLHNTQTVSYCTTQPQTVSKCVSSYTAQPLFQSQTSYPDRVCDAGTARESALVVRDAVVPRRRDDERELVVVGVCRHTLLFQTLGYTGDQNHSQVHGV